jgi:plastocyanin
MRTVFKLGVVFLAGIGVWACSGSGYGGGTSGSVTPSSPSDPGGIVTVNVVAINGAQSFSPNPATLPTGQRIVWHNIDTITHRVVLNDGSLDSGNLAPGTSSAPMTIPSAGAAYHCSIHPEMVGSVNMPSAPATPPSTY